MNESNIWACDTSSDSEDSVRRLDSEDANVSDENAEDDDLYETNMIVEVPGQGRGTHLEYGGRIKNSFQNPVGESRC
jgi:hypothetical protein